MTATNSPTPSKLSPSFSGTQDVECDVCKKAVYRITEKVTAEEVTYHRSCLRCHHEYCTLTPSYAAMGGVFYCTDHYSQLFQEGGSKHDLGKTETTDINAVLHCEAGHNSPTPSKLTSPFSRTQCATCKTTLHPVEKVVTAEGESYHKSCFRCIHEGCSRAPSYTAMDGIFYCVHHYSELFRDESSYNITTTANKNAVSHSDADHNSSIRRALDFYDLIDRAKPLRSNPRLASTANMK